MPRRRRRILAKVSWNRKGGGRGVDDVVRYADPTYERAVTKCSDLKPTALVGSQRASNIILKPARQLIDGRATRPHQNATRATGAGADATRLPREGRARRCSPRPRARRDARARPPRRASDPPAARPPPHAPRTARKGLPQLAQNLLVISFGQVRPPHGEGREVHATRRPRRVAFSLAAARGAVVPRVARSAPAPRTA